MTVKGERKKKGGTVDNEHRTAAKQIILGINGIVAASESQKMEVDCAIALAQVHATLALVEAVENLKSLSGQAISPIS